VPVFRVADAMAAAARRAPKRRLAAAAVPPEETLRVAIDPLTGAVRRAAPAGAKRASPDESEDVLALMQAAWSPGAVVRLTNCRVAEAEGVVWRDIWLQ